MMNTIEFNFGKPEVRPTTLAVHQWFRSLGIKLEQVSAIVPMQQTADHVICLTMKHVHDFKDFLEKYGGKQTMNFKSRMLPVCVKDASIKEKFVRLIDVRTYIDDDDITKKLNEYGTISMMRREKFRSSDDGTAGYFPVFNGTITIRMQIESDIPSYLWFGENRIFVRYEGQPSICMICNRTGHIGANCPSRAKPTVYPPRRWENIQQKVVRINNREPVRHKTPNNVIQMEQIPGEAAIQLVPEQTKADGQQNSIQRLLEGEFPSTAELSLSQGEELQEPEATVEAPVEEILQGKEGRVNSGDEEMKNREEIDESADDDGMSTTSVNSQPSQRRSTRVKRNRSETLSPNKSTRKKGGRKQKPTDE